MVLRAIDGKRGADEAKVSASATDAPPWSTPAGCRVRSSTGIRAVT